MRSPAECLEEAVRCEQTAALMSDSDLRRALGNVAAVWRQMATTEHDNQRLRLLEIGADLPFQAFNAEAFAASDLLLGR